MVREPIGSALRVIPRRSPSLSGISVPSDLCSWQPGRKSVRHISRLSDLDTRCYAAEHSVSPRARGYEPTAIEPLEVRCYRRCDPPELIIIMALTLASSSLGTTLTP